MKKVLFVDDDKISRDILKRYVEKEYEIDLAKTPEEALSLVKQKQYDVILMDIGLGYKMNGITLTKLIRKIKGYKNIPFIAVTAFATTQDEHNALEGGLDYYISKPFLKEQLLKLLKKALGEN